MNILKIIKEEIENHLFSESLNEYDEQLSQRVLAMIKNEQWEEKNPQSFHDSLMLSKHKEMLTVYSPSELSSMKLFKLANLNIGYALKTNDKKSFGEIVAVHNNEPDVKGIGEALMLSAVKNGGCFLDHFDSNKLTSLYNSTGFEEIDRDVYNPQYDQDGSFAAKYGKLDVIYRKHRSC
jgi:hypothetical protein